MASVLISSEVRDALGNATAERIEQDGVVAQCQRCGVQISTHRGDTAAIVLRRDLDGDIITYTHDACQHSGLIYSGTAQQSVYDDIIYRPIVLPVLNGPDRALLLVELSLSMGAFYTPLGDLMRPSLDVLCDGGWKIVETLGRELPTIPGWLATYDMSAHDGQIVDSHGNIFLDHLPQLGPWLKCAAVRRSLSVLIGPFNEEADTEFDLKNVQRLVREYSVAGIQIEFRCTDRTLDPVQHAGRRLAGSLKRLKERPARRPGERSDPRAAIRIFVEPLLTVSLIGGPTGIVFPILTIDFQDPDVSRAARSISVLKSLGFHQGADPGGTHLMKTAPAGWAMGVWQSQVLMLARHKGKTTNVLFERISVPNVSWHLAVREVHSVGVVIGNNLGPSALKDQELMIRSGEVLAMGIPAMAMT